MIADAAEVLAANEAALALGTSASVVDNAVLGCGVVNYPPGGPAMHEASEAATVAGTAGAASKGVAAQCEGGLSEEKAAAAGALIRWGRQRSAPVYGRGGSRPGGK